MLGLLAGGLGLDRDAVHGVKGWVATAMLILAIAAGSEGAEGQAWLALRDARLAVRVGHDALLAVGSPVM